MTTHPLAGKTVKLKIQAKHEMDDVQNGVEYRIEDWWMNVGGKSWMDCDSNPACMEYAVRSCGLPLDNKALYGKIGPFGHLVHESELGEVVS